jgi:hypothetical protein
MTHAPSGPTASGRSLFERQLKAFALAAGALHGGGAIASPIEWSGLINQAVPINGEVVQLNIGGLNTFQLNWNPESSYMDAIIGASSDFGVATTVTTTGGKSDYAANLPAGSSVAGSNTPFAENSSKILARYYLPGDPSNPPGSPYLGEWNAATNGTGYAGLRLTLLGEEHYGWMQISVPANIADGSNLTGQITLVDWAYCTVPGPTINAGQTSGECGARAEVPAPAMPALLLIGMGAAGLAQWRRRHAPAQPAC